MTTVIQCAALMLNVSVSQAWMKSDAPKSMPAVTATWPRKLNQPVNQDQAGPFFLASFADQ